MVLLCHLPFGIIVINHLPPVSLGQVKEDLMSSTREAAEFPVLLDPPSSPSAANRPVLAQVEGEGLWGPSGGFPRWPHACCCSRCSARALPPRCVLACFYNKDNSTASCRFSSLSLAGGTCESPVWLLATRPLSTKHQTQVKNVRHRQEECGLGSVSRDQPLGSLTRCRALGVSLCFPSALFSCL